MRLSDNLPVWKSLQVPRFSDGRRKYGKCDFLALVVIFKYMLPKEEFCRISPPHAAETEELKRVLPPFAMRRVYEETGLSGAWRKLDAMKK